MSAVLTGGKGRVALLGAVLTSLALAVSGCASNDASAPKSSAGAGGGSTAAAGGGSSSATGGSGGSGLNEPDTNGDGKVKIGVLSPGDINDNGYYESFVAAADTFAKQEGWTVIKRGSVPVADALSAARALCQQGVDMVALGASELKDAIPASEEAVCSKTAFYVPASANINQTPKIVISSDDPNQSMLAAGYAAGLKMKAAGDTKAGFVTGLKADFSVAAAKAFLAGIREIVPKATLVETYTGDFNDSAKAKEAVQAQLGQGAKVIYPYLGGATDAANALAQQSKAITLTPGTDRCGQTPKFDISVIFSPGDYFLAALKEFKADNLKMGTTRVWQMGKDPYPTVKVCEGSSDQAKVAQFIKDIGSGKINPADEVKRLNP
ncbi:type 1 periplasmic-binding domain-containing protein [Jatrophihabitans fulvus]